jgi:dipeptidyl aminopeptidase/acylaminoacyl peptidase
MFQTRTVSNRTGETHMLDLDTGERRRIANGRGPATYAGGLLLFSRGSTLAAQEFDDARGHLVGDARTIAGIEATTDLYAFSASSTVLVFHRQEPRRRQLLWFDRRGEVIGAEDDNLADVEGFALSPDGRRLAVVRRESGRDSSSIWLMELGSRRVTRLASRPGRDEFPVWSPDGSRLAVTSDRGENQGMHIVVRDLNGKEETLFQGPDAQLTDWSRDGRLLIYSARSPRSRSDLWMLPVTGDRKPQVLHQTPANESQGTLSPDGRLIAYVSDESGADEIYVRPFPPSEGRWQLSTAGGTRPRWRDDGRELMFLSPAGAVMSVQIDLAATPRLGVTQPLLDARGAEDFVVSGPRFLALMPVEQAGDRQLEVILNWASEVRR